MTDRVSDSPKAGATSSATQRSSVMDMRYGSGPPLTIGIEEEYMILDADTLGLASRIDDVLGAVEGSPIAGRIHPELMECTAEAATGVCRGIDDARRELTEIRRGLAAAMEPIGLRLAGTGTHPFSRSEDQRITPKDRYRALVEQLQYVARRELVFGMHVHVAVPDPDVAIMVMEGLVIELPVLLAMSANSPFWRGAPTGLSSTRTAIFAGFPRSGLPPRFESYEDYADTVEWLEESGVIEDYTHLWWDVRPHPRLGTIELRVPDVQFDIEQTLALVAYVQCLVREVIEEIEAGHAPVTYHRLLVAENKWQAARHGLDAPLIDLAAGKRETMKASDLIRRRLAQLLPFARELGCVDALAGIERILSWGTGATRQMRVYNANSDMMEVIREVADMTEMRESST